eukprot:TRINITY_DN20339_c0_g1_i1.p1 TRINITY_DN20339_c0_g1~~TRINITY_DN20339_c0_g1_i1.p1  ORF type:complete len:718 (+),score=161.18 TRINITY_DN20339_c0_g1_i1:44-2155(+)
MRGNARPNVESHEVLDRWNIRAEESEGRNVIGLSKRGRAPPPRGEHVDYGRAVYEEEAAVSPTRREGSRPPAQYGGVNDDVVCRPWNPKQAWFPPGNLPASPRGKKKDVGPPIFHLPAEARELLAVEAHYRGAIMKKRNLFIADALTSTACQFYARSGRWFHNSINRSFGNLSQAVLKTVGEEGVKGIQALRLKFIETYPDPRPPPPPASLLSGSTRHDTPSERSLHVPQERTEETKSISLSDAKNVLASLRASSGVCNAKGGADALTQASSSEDMIKLAKWLASTYHDKPGDLLDELANNLVAPKELNTSSQKTQLLAVAAYHLHETKGRCYPSRSPLDLLVMSLYTMTGPDIDTLFTFSDVPDFDTQREEWDAYGGRHPDRNKAIFSEINWAMRTATLPPNLADSAWQTLFKWCKYICVITGLSSIVGASPSTELARGLAGLPQWVVEKHRKLKKGDHINWPSPSSCALDRKVSEAYIRGDAANAVKAEGHSILFILRRMKWGIPLQDISKYPKESEVLVPPLSVLVVEDVTVLPCKHYPFGLPDGTLVVKAACENIIVLDSELVKHVRVWLRDSVNASRRVQQILGGLPQLGSITRRSSTLRLHTGSSYGKAIKLYGSAAIEPTTPSSPRHEQPLISPTHRLLKPTKCSQPPAEQPVSRPLPSQPLPNSSRMFQMTTSWEQKLLAKAVEGVRTPLAYDDL